MMNGEGRDREREWEGEKVSGEICEKFYRAVSNLTIKHSSQDKLKTQENILWSPVKPTMKHRPLDKLKKRSPWISRSQRKPARSEHPASLLFLSFSP